MSDPLEQLERELRTLRPPAPSVRVRRAIAEQLDGAAAGTTISRRRLTWRMYGPAAASLAAACLALTLFWLGPTRSAHHQAQPTPPLPVVTEAVNDPVPTWAAYRAAASRSPQALVALLDAHSGRILIPDNSALPSAWPTTPENRVANP